MSDRIRWAKLDDKDVLYIDYSNLSPKDMTGVIEEVKKTLSEIKSEKIYNIADISGSKFNEEVKAKFFNVVSEVQKYGLNLVLAVVGIEQSGTIIAEALLPGLFFAQDIQQAEEWIKKQS